MENALTSPETIIISLIIAGIVIVVGSLIEEIARRRERKAKERLAETLTKKEPNE